MTRKANCWEFTKCGREPGGVNAEDLGICLTSIHTQFDGINGGKNGGRVCWAISGTLCNGNVQGSLEEKQRYCMACSFYNKLLEEVKVEESVCSM